MRGVRFVSSTGDLLSGDISASVLKELTNCRIEGVCQNIVVHVHAMLRRGVNCRLVNN